MCGIIGLISKSFNGISKDTWELFLKVFGRLEVRGDKASGIVIWLDDGRFFITKQPIPSSQLAEKLSTMEIPLNKITMILGHAREPTQGSPYNNENNHPLYEIINNRLVAMVHNGHVYATKPSLQKKREVDSDYFLSLTRQNNVYDDAVIKETFRYVYGAYAVIFGDGKTMYMARNTNPLEQYIPPTQDAIIFASSFYDIVKGANAVEPYKIYKVSITDPVIREIAEISTYTYYNGYAYWKIYR